MAGCSSASRVCSCRAWEYTFSGATPSNAYPTTVYTIEYDGFADFPRYPLDIFSDLNAIFGDEHFYYHVLTTAQLDGAIPLPTSGPTMTHYYMVTGDQLPLLNPIRYTPVIGGPITDLLQPDLTYLVNLGYGDPRYGWSTGPANVPTPAGLFPPLSAFELMPGLLASGTQLGIHNFVADLAGTGPNPVPLALYNFLYPGPGTATGYAAMVPVLSALAADPYLLADPAALGPLLTQFLPPVVSNLVADPYLLADPAALGPLLTQSLPPVLSALVADPAALKPLVEQYLPYLISTTASGLYGKLLPTADILNAALISIPSYDVNLFLDGILQAVNGHPVSGLINAVGQPIASDIALYAMASELGGGGPYESGRDRGA